MGKGSHGWPIPHPPGPDNLTDESEVAVKETWADKQVYRSFFSGKLDAPFGTIGFGGIMTVYTVIDVMGYLYSTDEEKTDHRNDTILAFAGSGAQVYVDGGVIMLSIPPDEPRREYNLTIYYTKTV